METPTSRLSDQLAGRLASLSGEELAFGGYDTLLDDLFGKGRKKSGRRSRLFEQ
ncbi:MAG: hypothetical protein AABX32_00805 [Nanoarchaeota archaeon]